MTSSFQVIRPEVHGHPVMHPATTGPFDVRKCCSHIYSTAYPTMTTSNSISVNPRLVNMFDSLSFWCFPKLAECPSSRRRLSMSPQRFICQTTPADRDAPAILPLSNLTKTALAKNPNMRLIFPILRTLVCK